MAQHSKDCHTANVHQGEARGKVDTLHGYQTYIANPSSGTPHKAIVVILPDAFGWEFINLRLLADRLADVMPVQVLLPEFMESTNIDPANFEAVETAMDTSVPMMQKMGATLTASTRLVPFLFRNRQSVARPRVLGLFTALREANPSLPIGAAGYCWGGQWGILLGGGLTNDFDPAHAAKPTEGEGAAPAAPSKGLVDAVFTAHMSNVDIPSDIEHLRLPTCMSQGTHDSLTSTDQLAQIKTIVDRKNKEEGQTDKYVLHVVEGGTHGFAVRGNVDEDEEHAAMAKAAQDQLVTHFNKWLLKA